VQATKVNVVKEGSRKCNPPDEQNGNLVSTDEEKDEVSKKGKRCTQF